jgi:hypothetical protein
MRQDKKNPAQGRVGKGRVRLVDFDYAVIFGGLLDCREKFLEFKALTVLSFVQVINEHSDSFADKLNMRLLTATVRLDGFRVFIG